MMESIAVPGKAVYYNERVVAWLTACQAILDQFDGDIQKAAAHPDTARLLPDVIEIKLGSRVRLLPPKSLVLVQRPKDTDEKVFYHRLMPELATEILRRASLTTIAVGVEEFAQLQVLSEERMEKYNWVRKERVFLMKDEVEIHGDTEEE